MGCRVLCPCRIKQIRIQNNNCEYINNYFITPLPIKINSGSPKVGWWGDKYVFRLIKIDGLE